MYNVVEPNNQPSPLIQDLQCQDKEADICKLFLRPLEADVDHFLGFPILENLNYLTIAQELYKFRDAVDSRISNGFLLNKDILQTMASTNPSKLELSQIPATWGHLSKIDQDVELRPVESRIFTALSLKAHSDIWTWFSWNVTEPVLLLLKVSIQSHNDESLQTQMPNPWIFRLFQKVQVLILLHKDINLTATDFFEDLEAPPYTSTYGIESKILTHIESAVSLWLQFRPRPGMSLTASRAVASFIQITSTVFRGTDFLYLSFIQERIKTLRANLTNCKIDLAKIPWGQLVKALEVHPLADPHSKESISVRKLKELLWAVSGLPNPIFHDVTTQYKIAVELGGSKGVAAFVRFATLPYPM